MTAKIRVDKWLWAVRLHKTRTAANEACASGRVRVNDEVAKAATKVTPGDRVSVRQRGETRIVEVRALHEKRVGAPIAADAYIDHTPPRPAPSGEMPVAEAARRERGAGRPTKRDRRQIDRLRRN